MFAHADLFTHDQSYTVGVEEEYMLCHPSTGDLVPRADRILAHLDKAEREGFAGPKTMLMGKVAFGDKVN